LYQLIEFTDEDASMNLFLSLPGIVYKNDTDYSAEKKGVVVSWLKGEHPCSGFLVQKNLLVVRDKAPVARGIAFVNLLGHFGSIGFFECLEDRQAVQLLVDGARAFCKEKGVRVLFAPMNGSIWSSYRLRREGACEERPFLGEPYNRPYYEGILASCGFTVAYTWESQFVKKAPLQGKDAARYNMLEGSKYAQSITVRSLQNFDEDIRTIHKLAMNAFAGFYLFHEIDEATFVGLFAGLEPLCDKRTALIASNKEGQPIGFAIALPDYQSKLGYLFRHAKRYVVGYMGTLQKDGKSIYPACATALAVSLFKSLLTRGKGYVCALMGEGAKSLTLSKDYESKRTYALLKLEID